MVCSHCSAHCWMSKISKSCDSRHNLLRSDQIISHTSIGWMNFISCQLVDIQLSKPQPITTMKSMGGKNLELKMEPPELWMGSMFALCYINFQRNPTQDHKKVANARFRRKYPQAGICICICCNFFYINNVVGWADVDPTFQQENRKWLIADSVLLESEIKDLIESGLKEHILWNWRTYIAKGRQKSKNFPSCFVKDNCSMALDSDWRQAERTIGFWTNVLGLVPYLSFNPHFSIRWILSHTQC